MLPSAEGRCTADTCPRRMWGGTTGGGQAGGPCSRMSSDPSTTEHACAFCQCWPGFGPAGGSRPLFRPRPRGLPCTQGLPVVTARSRRSRELSRHEALGQRLLRHVGQLGHEGRGPGYSGSSSHEARAPQVHRCWRGEPQRAELWGRQLSLHAERAKVLGATVNAVPTPAHR